MKIAIIGANGYIGRNLLHAATAAGHQVTAYDYTESQVDGYPDYHQINLNDLASLSALDLNVDAIYMMAGRTGTAEGFDKYDEFIDGNEKFLLNLLTEYRRQGSNAKIIFPSTRLVYKGRYADLKEDDPKEFKTVYAVGKFAAEQYLQQFGKLFGVRFTILRLCIPFGTLVPDASSYGTLEFMLSKARANSPITLYGDGSLRRTFTNISDVADVFLKVSEPGICENDIYNIGGNTYSLLDVAQLISNQYQVGIEHIEWPQMALALESGDTVFDATKLTNKIGTKSYSLVEAWLQSTI